MALKLLPLLARREVDLVDVERRSAEWGLLGRAKSMLWGGSSAWTRLCEESCSVRAMDTSHVGDGKRQE